MGRKSGIAGSRSVTTPEAFSQKVDTGFPSENAIMKM
jgi:hypothetical protein